MHFLPTIWPTSGDQKDIDSSCETNDDPVEIDLIVVPVSADGSVFHPGLTRSGKFTVGA
ncbi:hypothetical protein [Roseibium sp. RKSG952]|uniref:hypothetical protein n=1 Tax=Roseibium sp. RKSG952 TaxID=2529384 RepID=UPI0012BB7664|nr:hypothetical protein [Roseibium sp. RKSG952]